jgi:hypothetical protein
MSEQWNRGVKILNNLRNDFAGNPDRLKDIGLAEALGIQFESGYNILRFYALREQLFNAEHTRQKPILNEMEAIVHGEINRSERLIELCENDSRLGFHSEAEGYKYFPEKLEWRITMLKNLLAEDFSKAQRAIAAGKLDLPNTETTPAYICGSGKFEQCETFRWQADIKNNSLVFKIECEQQGCTDQLFLSICAGDNSYPLLIDLDKSGRMFSGKSVYAAKVTEHPAGWSSEIIIPSATFDCKSQKSVRLNIVRFANLTGNAEFCCWPERKYSVAYRLNLGMYNPSAMGKLILEL